jgi:hypothetical protein
MVTIDLSNYCANQSEWGRALSALGRHAQKLHKKEAREYGELAAEALKRAIHAPEDPHQPTN